MLVCVIAADDGLLAQTTGSLRMMEELLSFVKQRASVEENYSKSLLKLSQQCKYIDLH